VSYEKNISYVKSCAFCISPTLIENFGMAILEATFVGLPVITFDVGGNADIIRDGINGFLVDFMDIESLVNKSIELLTNEKLNEKMRDNSYNYATENFSSGKTIDQYKHFFNTIDVIYKKEKK
jgi:glycosyltransferase involved in cell wall biosynthesis